MFPCLKILKHRKTFEDETFDNIIEPFGSSLINFFIVLFTTSLGITDVGIAVVLGETAFKLFIDKGILICFAGPFGRFDCFNLFKDGIVLTLLLLFTSFIHIQNKIMIWNSAVSLGVFIVVMILLQCLKGNYIQEHYGNTGSLKQTRLTEDDIFKLHNVSNSELTYTPESLMSETYDLENGYLIYNYKNVQRRSRVRILPVDKIQYPKLAQCVNRIICGKMCKVLKQRIERHLFAQSRSLDSDKIENQDNEDSKIHITDNTPRGSAIEGSKTPIEGTLKNSELTMRQGVSQRLPMTLYDDAKTSRLLKETIDLSKVKSQLSDTESVNSDDEKNVTILKWPKDILPRIWFILTLPLNLLFYITIPDPKNPPQDKFNTLPFVYIISIIWIGFFSLLISWLLVYLSISFDKNFIVFPFILTIICIIIGSMNSWISFRSKIIRLKRIACDNGIEETPSTSGNNTQYSKQETIHEKIRDRIFLYGLEIPIIWIIYTLVNGTIVLITNRFWLHLLILVGMYDIKILLIVKAKFLCPRWLFIVHALMYIVYVVIFFILEYV